MMSVAFVVTTVFVTKTISTHEGIVTGSSAGAAVLVSHDSAVSTLMSLTGRAEGRQRHRLQNVDKVQCSKVFLKEQSKKYEMWNLTHINK